MKKYQFYTFALFLNLIIGNIILGVGNFQYQDSIAAALPLPFSIVAIVLISGNFFLVKPHASIWKMFILSLAVAYLTPVIGFGLVGLRNGIGFFSAALTALGFILLKLWPLSVPMFFLNFVLLFGFSRKKFSD